MKNNRLDQFQAAVKQYNSSAIQINHMNKPPISVLNKLDPTFTANIQTQHNPSKIYDREMKMLYIDELDRGLSQKTSFISKKKQEEESNRKDYRERINGVLCELEKNSLTYNLTLKKKMNQQQERSKSFVDESKLKSQRIDNLVNSHEDKDRFNHQNDLYQSFQKSQLQKSLSILQKQRQSKIVQNNKIKTQKLAEQQMRTIHERELELSRQQAMEDRKISQRRYQNDLAGMVRQKQLRNSLGSTLDFRPQAHNPITNPIEYHIQNPYLLKRMYERKCENFSIM